MDEVMQMRAAPSIGRQDEAKEAYGGIVPRWEWRAFDQKPIGAELREFEISPTSKPRVETYVLSSLSDDSVKIRDDRLEIKRFE